MTNWGRTSITVLSTVSRRTAVADIFYGYSELVLASLWELAAPSAQASCERLEKSRATSAAPGCFFWLGF